MNGFYDLPFFPIGPNEGTNGKDGVSPTISVENISGGHRLIIVDTTGRKTVDVLNGVDGQQGIPGKDGTNGKSAYEYAQSGGYTGTEAEFINLLANSVSKQNISLGIHSDGLLYLFIDGEPIGTGISITATPEA